MSPYRDAHGPAPRRAESDELPFAAVVLLGAAIAFALAHAEGGPVGAVETLAALVIALVVGERGLAVLRARRAAGSHGTSTPRWPRSRG